MDIANIANLQGIANIVNIADTVHIANIINIVNNAKYFACSLFCLKIWYIIELF